MIRRPPRSTLDRSSAASDVYKSQVLEAVALDVVDVLLGDAPGRGQVQALVLVAAPEDCLLYTSPSPQTVLDIVCRLLLEKKKKSKKKKRVQIRGLRTRKRRT